MSGFGGQTRLAAYFLRTRPDCANFDSRRLTDVTETVRIAHDVLRIEHSARTRLARSRPKRALQLSSRRERLATRMQRSRTRTMHPARSPRRAWRLFSSRSCCAVLNSYNPSTLPSHSNTTHARRRRLQRAFKLSS
ncbi:hypothetical protein EXIGLDRAFT_39367 [Exidia glandulosa HHB12029]|uniref:Uncharacterized protein n=1 Tax=Exidia glandulosa HHB12029 TaxID=1314781 RepID=A0A165INC6_EXIGL|nr:hypothetical protein EXIGLDRAFT_39367 [Exidia glandulosa HHB12029]